MSHKKQNKNSELYKDSLNYKQRFNIASDA